MRQTVLQNYSLLQEPSNLHINCSDFHLVLFFFAESFQLTGDMLESPTSSVARDLEFWLERFDTMVVSQSHSGADTGECSGASTRGGRGGWVEYVPLTRFSDHFSNSSISVGKISIKNTSPPPPSPFATRLSMPHWSNPRLPL